MIAVARTVAVVIYEETAETHVHQMDDVVLLEVTIHMVPSVYTRVFFYLLLGRHMLHEALLTLSRT